MFYTLFMTFSVMYVYKDMFGVILVERSDFIGSIVVLSLWVSNNWGSWGCIHTQTWNFKESNMILS